MYSENLKKGIIYPFLKKGQRNYWLNGEIPLIETKGEGKLSRPKAGIVILEATHFLKRGEAYTKGKYKVMGIFKDNNIHFEGFNKI